VWGNRQECLIQIRPGTGVGHIPLIETVGDVPINRIDQGTGLATGNLEIASSVFVNQSPFGGEVTITGEIGLPPDSYGGSALPFKYKIEVQKQDGVDTFHPLLNDISVSVAEWNSVSDDVQSANHDNLLFATASVGAVVSAARLILRIVKSVLCRR
jgi:hypothetical protein